MNHNLNTGFTPLLVIMAVAILIGLCMMESRNTGISIWRRIGEAIATVTVVFGIAISSIFVGIEYGFRTLLKVTAEHYRAMWAHHINAKPISHATIEPETYFQFTEGR